MTRTTRIEQRLRTSGLLIAMGLLVEALSLIHTHPLAFLGFMFIGGALFLAGITVYLLSVAVASPPSAD